MAKKASKVKQLKPETSKQKTAGVKQRAEEMLAPLPEQAKSETDQPIVEGGLLAVTTPDEKERAVNLDSLDIINSQPEIQFDDIVETASLIAGTPIAYISFLDEKREWFKSRKGLDIQQTPRDISLGGHVIQDLEHPLVITDISHDPRFSENPLVVGYPYLSFYAGAAIVTAAGYAVGVVAVADHQPRSFTAEQTQALRLLADKAAGLVELRRDTGTLTAGLLEERARAAESLVWRKNHDQLTSLPNRSVLEQRIRQLDQDEIQSNNPRVVSLIAIDLVHFGEVNFSIGRDGGDRALCQVAYLLSGCLPARAMLSRVDNTVFAALLIDTEASEAARIAQEIHSVFSKEIDIPNFPSSFIPMVIGTATSGPRHGFAPSEVLLASEVGIAEAKRLGAGSTVAARWESFARRERVAKLRNKLRTAIDSGDVYVAYMPLVRLSDQKIIGNEALARWDDPDFGEVEPDEFVPIGEHNGFINDLDAFVLERALKEFADGALQGDEISVNISPGGVRPGFSDAVLAELQKAGVAPEKLTIEITERAGLSSNSILVTSLVALGASGVKIALDDFGSGETAIAHLRSMPINRLKIDNSLIVKLDDDPQGENKVIIEAIVAMADGLEIETLAEGIETDTQLQVLLSCGIVAGQGFLFGRPQPARDEVGKQ